MNRVESFARDLRTGVTSAVRQASTIKTSARLDALKNSFKNPASARNQASEIKDYVIENFDELLTQFEAKATQNGIQIHHAATPENAREIILKLCQNANGPIVKGKSMATEEIHLNAALIEAGHEVVETDLGEFVVQLDGDTPSHIVTPIIHRTRQDVARSFLKAGIGPYTEDPAELAMQARKHLREKFKNAAIGISGVNFAVAETGRLVIVENEGNNRLSTTAPDIHIAVMGIEKLLPSETDLAVFLPLLAGSATGQNLTVYTHFITSPRKADEPDGPSHVHLVLLDCGRRKILESKFKEVLKCIRCGACLNVCPVYRQVSGHGYRHVYPGPIGAVLAPLLDPAFADLPHASTLCGACHEVCPVKIPIADLLVLHRSNNPTSATLSDTGFKKSATNPRMWQSTRRLAAIAMAATDWTEFHKAPEQQEDFRKWRRSNPPTPSGDKCPSDLESQAKVQVPKDSTTNSKDALSWKGRAVSGANWGGVPGDLESQASLVVTETSKTVADALKQLSPTLTVVCDDNLSEAVTKAGFKLADVWGADAGITCADAYIQETGTLILSTGEGKLRKASLCPPIHIAIVRQSQIVETLAEGIAKLGERTSVLITGPSRTADIEGVLVKGVHGPGEVIVIFVEG